MSRIVDTTGIWYMRISGQSAAGWFCRELRVPLSASAGRLQVTRRASLAPRGVNVAIGVMQDTDQTRSAAIGDVMNLSWRSEHAAQP
jgi:hypothetical protein